MFRLTGEESAIVDQWDRRWVLCATVALMALIVCALAVILYSLRSNCQLGTSTAAAEDSMRRAAETVAAVTEDDDKEMFIRHPTSRRQRIDPSEDERGDTTPTDEQDSNVTAVAENDNEQQRSPLNEMGSAFEWG